MNSKHQAQASKFMLFLVAFFIASSIALELVAIIFESIGVGGAFFSSLWFMIIAQVVRLILPMFIWMKLRGEKFEAHMPRQPIDGMNALYVVIITACAIPVAMFISGISNFFADNDVAEMLGSLSDAGNSWIMMMLAVAVTPGIVEEVVFRGYLQSLQKGSIHKIAVFNGFLFGIMHLNLHQFLYTFALGVLFAYIVYYTRSIWMGILSHFIVNGSQVTFMHMTLRSLAALGEQEGEPLTFAQQIYDIYVDIDPALAQSLYNFFNNISEELLAVGIISVFAIGAGIAGGFVLRAFIKHNVHRNAIVDAMTREHQKITAEGDIPMFEMHPRDYKSFEVYSALHGVDGRELMPRHTDEAGEGAINYSLIAVILIYLLFTIILPLL